MDKIIHQETFSGVYMTITETIQDNHIILQSKLDNRLVSAIRKTNNAWVVEKSSPLLSPISYAVCQAHITNKMMSLMGKYNHQ